MTRPKSFHLPANVHRYLLEHSSPLDDVVNGLIAETAGLGSVAGMQISPEQGLFMGLLARAVGARRAVEVGTFTGLSALCVARAMGPGGRLVCCDVSEEWTAVARRWWAAAGVDDRIELRLGPAAGTLRALPEGRWVDMAFIDADKESYITYWELLVPRMRPGGLILVDNVLWSGRVADPGVDDDTTRALRAFNDHVAADARAEVVMLPVADGLTVARIH